MKVDLENVTKGTITEPDKESLQNLADDIELFIKYIKHYLNSTDGTVEYSLGVKLKSNDKTSEMKSWNDIVNEIFNN